MYMHYAFPPDKVYDVIVCFVNKNRLDSCADVHECVPVRVRVLLGLVEIYFIYLFIYLFIQINSLL